MEPEEWFWEGHVQRRVEEHFRVEGWAVLSAADTAARETGIDLVLERAGERLNVEVKGWPSTTYRRGEKAGQPKPTAPTLQARHWYAGAFLTAALLRDADGDARVALAFPDFPRYRKLLRSTARSLAALRVEALLVPEDGPVALVDPATFVTEGPRSPRRGRGSVPADVQPSSAPGELTLHEAMTLVLQRTPDGRLPAAELASEINRRGLYRMRGGRPVQPGQIHARARNYVHLFVAGDGAVGLRR